MKWNAAGFAGFPSAKLGDGFCPPARSADSFLFRNDRWPPTASCTRFLGSLENKACCGLVCSLCHVAVPGVSWSAVCPASLAAAHLWGGGGGAVLCPLPFGLKDVLRTAAEEGRKPEGGPHCPTRPRRPLPGTLTGACSRVNGRRLLFMYVIGAELGL